MLAFRPAGACLEGWTGPGCLLCPGADSIVIFERHCLGTMAETAVTLKGMCDMQMPCCCSFGRAVLLHLHLLYSNGRPEEQ